MNSQIGQLTENVNNYIHAKNVPTQKIFTQQSNVKAESSM